jgi:cystathionine beta-lyase/cystathionine gamma-synthase
VNNVERAIRKNTRMVFVGNSTNPLAWQSRSASIAKVRHARKVEVVVDNTFMSPYFQQPLTWADMVVHSTTKF